MLNLSLMALDVSLARSSAEVLKQQVSSLTARQKAIMLVASAALACFTIFFLIRQYCLKSTVQQPSNEVIEKETPVFDVTVDYQVDLSRSRLIDAIRKINNPQVIFWYIGVYGFREQGKNYYRKDLTKILQTSEADCYLYDLTAWLPFSPKGSDGAIDSLNQNAELINRFAIPRIKCLKSCDYFNWLISCQPGQIMTILKRILKRPFIYKISESFPPSIKSIGDIFKRQCPLLEDMYEQTASKCYSALQYLEGIYLIQTLVKEAIEKDPFSNEINVVFALPNKEYLYFRDETNSLVEDVKDTLDEKCKEMLKGKKINLQFCCFRYGDGEGNRPYNAGAKNTEMIQGPSDIVNLPKQEA